MGGWLDDFQNGAKELWDTALGDGETRLDDEAKESFWNWAEKDDDGDEDDE